MHVPKTGGSWVKKAIIASGINHKDYRIDGDPHLVLKQCPVPEKFKFAFVRHPVQFYRSYWQFKMTNGWDKKNPIDMECKSENFNVFVRKILDKYPGRYGDALVEFVGEEKEEIEFVGKYENLVDDLIAALKYAGEVFSEDAIRTLLPYNVSDKKKFPAQYTEELEQEVIKSEIQVIKRFGYG